PDGRYLAVTGIIGDRRMLSLVRLADMKTVSIKPRDREDIDRFWWVAADRVMYTIAVHFGSILNPRGTGELFTVDADGEKSQIIFALRMGNESGPSDGGVSERAAGELIAPLRDDPHHAVIASYSWQSRGSRDDTIPSAFKIDLGNGHKTPLV